jgi:hypothetical protein
VIQRQVLFLGRVGSDVEVLGMFVLFEQSRERVLGDELLMPAHAPFGPWTALDPGQFVDEPRSLLQTT